MSKFKKVLSLILVVAMTAGIAITGTIAYFTSEDSEVNVMTVGNVQVKLEEKQRNEDGSALEDFEQGKELTPLVGSAQGEKDQWGQPTAKNYVDKIVYATNNGMNDAYIRILVALPKELVKPDSIADNILHWSFGNRVDITGESKYNDVAYADSDWAKAFEYVTLGDSVTIDDEEYMVTYFTMQEALEPGENSLAVMAGMYLDKRVDYNADLGKYTFDGVAFDYDLSKGVKVPVLLQAVQTDGWDTIDQAFGEAFGVVNVAKVEEWFGDVEMPAVVDDEKSLADALAEGNNVVMTADIAAEAATTAPYGNKVAFTQNGGVLDGNGNTLSVECYGDDYGIMTSGGTIKNLTIDSGCRAIMIMSPTGDVIVDNVNIGGDGVLYTINTGEAGPEGVKLSVTNSTLAGWTSYGPVVESASFTNVKFEQGEYKDYASIYGRVLKPYVNTTLTDCSFIEHMNLDLSSLTEGHKVTFTNCTVNGQAVTADVFTPYSGDDSVYDTALFSVDLPSWADSIADCIIFN